MVRFFWHVDDGCSAHVPVNGYSFDGDSRCLTVEISAPGVAGSATAMLSLPPCNEDGTSRPLKNIGVVIAHDTDASSWQNRLIRSIAKCMAKHNFLVVRNYCNLKELRRLRMFDKAVDTAVKCPYAAGVQTWLLVGLGNGARVATTIAGKTKARVAGVAVLSYPLNEPTPPAGKGAGFPTSQPQLVKLTAPLLAVHGAADTRCPPATMQTFLQESITHTPGPRLVVIPGVDQSLDSSHEHTSTTCCTLVVRALLEFAHALSGGDASAARLPAATDQAHDLPAAAADFASAADTQPVPPAAGAFRPAANPPAAAAAPAARPAQAPVWPAGTPPVETTQPPPAAAAAAAAAHPSTAAQAAQAVPPMQPGQAAHHQAGTLPIAPIAPLALPQGLALGPGSHDPATVWHYSAGPGPGVQAGMHGSAASAAVPLHASAAPPAHGQLPFAFAVRGPSAMAGPPLAEGQPGFPPGMVAAGLGPSLPHAHMPHAHLPPHALTPGLQPGMAQGLPHGLPMQGALPPGLLQGLAPGTPVPWPAAAAPTAAAARPAGQQPPLTGPLPVAPLFMSGPGAAARDADENPRDDVSGP